MAGTEVRDWMNNVASAYVKASVTTVYQGANLIKPVSGLALLDTGADHSCLPASMASHQGAVPVRSKDFHHMDGTVRSNMFMAAVKIDGLPFAIETECATLTNDQFASGICMVIGRDILTNFELHLRRGFGSYIRFDPPQP